MPKAITRESLLEEIQRLSSIVDGTPALFDVDEHGEFSRDPFYREFGSWNDALLEAGLQINREGKVSYEQLQEEMHRMADELGRPPKKLEMDEMGKYSGLAYYRRFDGWNNALREFGYEPVKRDSIPEEELIAELQRVSQIVGGHVRQTDMWDKGEFSPVVYHRRFGSWRNAHDEAGIEYTDEEMRGGEMTYDGNVRESYYGANWEAARRRCLRRDGGECRVCGEDEGQMEVHHINPISSFETYEDANVLSNLVTLCPTCHRTNEGKYTDCTPSEFVDAVN